MSLIKFKKVNKSYGSRSVLKNISFTIEPGQKIALVGYNGVGKSTLLKIIAGIEDIDSGLIDIKKETKIGYLPQDLSFLTKQTVEGYLFENEKKPNDKLRLKILIFLTGFGFETEILSFQLDKLSTGQKTKIQLIKILLTEPDLILLDEPTNNLDIPSLIWLENFLQEVNLTCIVVSHDRKFLDKVVGGVMELDWAQSEILLESGSYTNYLKRRQDEFNKQKEDYENQQEKIDNPIARKGLNMDIDRKGNEKKFWIKLSEVIVGHPQTFKLNPLSLDISLGERVAILGLNGSGKTSLLKTITGELKPLAGERSIGSKVFFGNLTQEYTNLPKEKTVIEFMKLNSDLNQSEIFSLLVKFGLNEKNITGKIISLSPGERARVLFALFTVKSINCLVLDEPTNNLDMETMEALEEMLKDYSGSLLIVSHDRYFLEKIKLDKILIIKEKNIETIYNLNDHIKTLEKKALKMIRALK
ncbi:MAG: ABC-F family ATP-binding cassette domain-containing protein [Patescibacteria group bacterium]